MGGEGVLQENDDGDSQQMEMILREYQQEFIAEIYAAIKEGNKRVCGQLPTGAGKTACSVRIVKDALQNGWSVHFVVKRRHLIFQTAKVYDKEGVSLGINMSDHPRYRPRATFQISSIDTLDSRSLYPFKDDNRVLHVIDEAHDCHPGNGRYAKMVEAYKDHHMIGLTATPYGDNSHWQKVIRVIEPFQLRDEGYLVPEKVFVPSVVGNAQMDEDAINNLMTEPKVVGDVVKNWLRYSEKRPTIVFATTVEHSKKLVDEFAKNGIEMVHMDAGTPQKLRDRYIRQLKTGRIQGLINVGILHTGLDLPFVSCLLFARPSASLIWWIQALGRGLRTCRGKEDCIVIDTVGNTYRHGGAAYKIREIPNFKSVEKKDEVPLKVCSECLFIFDKGNVCPACGSSLNKELVRREVIEQVEGELSTYKLSDAERQEQERKILFLDYEKLKRVAQWKGFKPRWVHYKLKEKHKMETLLRYRRQIDFPLELL